MVLPEFPNSNPALYSVRTYYRRQTGGKVVYLTNRTVTPSKEKWHSLFKVMVF
jgi:hypothetical protein